MGPASGSGRQKSTFSRPQLAAVPTHPALLFLQPNAVLETTLLHPPGMEGSRRAVPRMSPPAAAAGSHGSSALRHLAGTCFGKSEQVRCMGGRLRRGPRGLRGGPPCRHRPAPPMAGGLLPRLGVAPARARAHKFSMVHLTAFSLASLLSTLIRSFRPADIARECVGRLRCLIRRKLGTRQAG